MHALKITLFVLLSYFVCLTGAWSSETEIKTSIARLATAKGFPEIEKIVKELAALGDPLVNPALTALADGNLQIRKSDQLVFITKESGSGVTLIDPVTGKEAGVTTKTEVQKIKVNNGLRRIIRDSLGNLTLQSPDTATRLSAAETIFKNSDASQLAALDAAIASEADSKVKAQLELARASAILNSDRGDDEKVQAIKLIKERGGRDALSLLTAIEAKTSGLVKDQAGAAVVSIERTLAFWATGQNVWYGLSLGSVLLLAAIGLAITFGVMGVINMAHGEMVMLGAYTTFVTQDIIRDNFPGLFDWSLLIALPLAFLVAAIVGVIIERGIIRHLYGRPLETLLATWGVSLILQQGVRSIFGPTNQEVGNPSWMSGSFQIGELDVTWNRLWIIVFSLIVFFVLLVALNKTPLGLQMRAVTQNRRMASAMGIRTPFVDSMTFALGSGIAGIAGVALSQIDNVSPNLGQSYIIDSFMVVVFGGVGNLWGTLVGALSLGILNKFLEPFAGAVLGKILVLILIILFIQKRPRGLFALKGRAVEA
ncbi:MAG TPA: urea ABC transporter permease subunit UrtB [Aestuariivirga sp.]|nr:urea ABC transporter permease subunit UrtB [Aestuariivirga sp.]